MRIREVRASWKMVWGRNGQPPNEGIVALQEKVLNPSEPEIGTELWCTFCYDIR